ncbi:MAG: mono/diheme cytochrome c family protein [Pirellulaceae bacterium]|jgi:mono/diheme cytochrome c family protein
MSHKTPSPLDVTSAIYTSAIYTFAIRKFAIRKFAIGVLTIGVIAILAPSASGDEKPDFNRDILPILSQNCFACHGPDENVREAGLRLDQEETIFAKLESGATAVVRGKSGESALVHRINSTDAEMKMPPGDSGKSLTKAQAELLTKWVDSGADWSKHWAFEPPQKSAPPAPIDDWKVANSIDLFIHKKVKQAKFAPEQTADKFALIRRVSLDMTGLPPTIKEIDDFLADNEAGAYARVVDRLLASKHYGEHMARVWLDAARYADTHGLHLDNERQIWPYRNWVIDAFNRNLSFDQFTIQQLAGDLLPETTLDQRVATGFNRCNVTTSEGGSIDDEYYVRYAVDRVETTSTVWLGLTSGCAACHDHKFDPLKQKEFYQLFSYFFSLTERAMDGNNLLPPPSVKIPQPEQTAEIESHRKEITSLKPLIEKVLAEAESNYKDPTPAAVLGKLEQEEYVWFDDALPPGAAPEGDDAGNSWKFVSAPDHPVFSGKTSSLRTGVGLTQHFFSKVTDKFVLGDDDQLFAYVYLDPKNPPETVQLQFNNGTWEHRAFWGADKGHGAGRNNASNLRIGDLPETGKWVRLEVSASQVGLPAAAQINGWAFTQFGGTVYWDKPGRISIGRLQGQQAESLAVWEQYRQQIKQPALPAPIQQTLDIEKAKRTPEQVKQLRLHYVRNVNPTSAKAIEMHVKREAELTQKIADIEKNVPSTLVMEDRKDKRQAHILERGQYAKKLEPVSSAIPEWISAPLEDQPENRLGLAQWLVKKDHPLTSRVTVNRYWQHFFGTGIVKTSEDFGVQGERPSHPELLDWLAVDFIESGWNIKRIQKMMVMSATYQQSSRVTADKNAADPDNRLLAHGPRFRLDAEVIRDQALAISGLLVDKIGGPSVKPYQPAGLWKPVGFGGSNTSVFKQDTGNKLYRRSMYTFWKRTSPPPSMSTFDAPDRETCRVRRSRTNTPLQALVLMNDVQFVEAARKFAEKIMQEGGEDAKSKVNFAFRSILTRSPNEMEQQALEKLFAEYLVEFQAATGSALELLKAGESPRNEKLEADELAAWTLVAHLIFNLSEAVTRG